MAFGAETSKDVRNIFFFLAWMACCGILYFNNFDIRLSDLTPEIEMDEEDPRWMTYSLLSRVAERNKTIDLHLTLLQDGQAIYTETVTLNP